MSELTPLLRAAISFAYVGGFGFVAVGVLLMLMGLWASRAFHRSSR